MVRILNRKSIKKRLLPGYRKSQIIRKNLSNRLKYGKIAPRYEEIIWVYAKSCPNHLSSIYLREKYGVNSFEARAKIIESTWPVEQVMPVIDLPLMQNCIAHWVEGISWEETGEYGRMERLIKTSKAGISHGCKTRADIIRRCENLDMIFVQAKQDCRLRTQEEIDSKYLWGASEILIHIGPGGELLKGGEGMHRFAIAYILDIPFPAQISFIHVSALPALEQLRLVSYSDVCKG